MDKSKKSNEPLWESSWWQWGERTPWLQQEVAEMGSLKEATCQDWLVSEREETWHTILMYKHVVSEKRVLIVLLIASWEICLQPDLKAVFSTIRCTVMLWRSIN